MVDFLKGKYFYRVLALVSVAILLTINLLSFALYKNYEKSSMKKFKETNIEVLNETSRMNEYIGKTVKLSGMTLLYESPIQKLIRNQDVDNFEKVQAIRRMDSVQSMGIHIHSIYLYNGDKKYMYSTSNYQSDFEKNFYDREIIEILNSKKNLRGLQPIPRWIDDGKERYPVYTYFFFSNNSTNYNSSALIINLDVKWLKEIEGETEGTSLLYILDQEKRIVYNRDFNKFLQDESQEAYIEEIYSSKQKDGYFIERIQGKDYLVIYSKPENQEWYFIKLMLYKSLVDDIIVMRNKTIKIIMFFLVIGLILAFFLSKRLSNPIDNWVMMVKDFGIKKDSDDISYLTSSIENILVKTSDLENMSKAYLDDLHRELLKEILSGNINGEKSIRQVLDEYNISLSYHGRYYIILCYKGIKYNGDYSNFNFGQVNFKLDIGDNTIYILANESSGNVLRWIEEFKSLEVETIVISGLIRNIGDFHKTYVSLNELLKEKIFYPRGHVLYYDYVKERYESPEYPFQKEREVISCLRKGKTEDAIISFENFLKINSRFKYDYFKFHMIRFIISLQNLIDDLELNEYFIDFNRIKRDYFESYLEEIYHVSEITNYFKDIFISIEEKINEEKSRKNRSIIKKAIEYIHNNFQDSNLNLQMISDAVGFSSSYITQIAKMEKDISLSEYIVDYRIQKAKEYLIEKDFTIKEIANMVGFNNDNYFYTVFKKNTNMTPGEYRRKQAQKGYLKNENIGKSRIL